MIDYLKDIMSEHLLFCKDGDLLAIDLYEFEVDNSMRHEAGYYFACVLYSRQKRAPFLETIVSDWWLMSTTKKNGANFWV